MNPSDIFSGPAVKPLCHGLQEVGHLLGVATGTGRQGELWEVRWSEEALPGAILPSDLRVYTVYLVYV